jgi:hypothetical protein
MTTAAHQVLQCGELYHLICKNCDIHTLSALSRTSRDLQDTALDLLWSEIPSLGHLIRCMPSDLWEEREKEHGYRSTLIIITLIVLPGYAIKSLVVLLQGNTDHRLA